MEELCARDLSNDMSDKVHLRLRQYLRDCVQNNSTIYDEWTIFPNNTPKTMRMAFSTHMLEDGRAALLIQILDCQVDATPSALHSMQALMHTSTMISVFNEQLELVYANPAARTAFGSCKMSLVDYIAAKDDRTRVIESFKNEGSCSLELLVNTYQGQFWHAVNIQTSPDPENGRPTYLISATDVTEKRRVQQEQMLLAFTDPLTKLPNRLALLDEIKNRINKHPDESFSLLFIDLDRLKVVNDTLGHAVGDSLIVATSKLLKSVTGDGGTVARLGGNEFVFLFSGTPSDLELTIQRILDLARSPIKVDEYGLRISPTIGVSTFPDNGDSETALLHYATVAMCSAKAHGCGFQHYNRGMGILNKARLLLETDLVAAIRTNQFELYYQPKVCADTFEILEMEALIRWQHPTRGLISPLEFIPLAEETGLIFDIGEWVIRQALQDQAKWEAIGHRISVAVNVSPKQFISPDFLERLRALLAESDCPPHRLNLEVTESSLITDEAHVQDILTRLSNDGIKVSIDDFGTGYSNLANLHKYPIHYLKIDRAFLKDNNDTALLTTILEMGKSMNMTVVAEGVETTEQIEWLQAHGCDQLQGYYFSKPVPYTAALELMSTRRKHAQIDTVAA